MCTPLARPATGGENIVRASYFEGQTQMSDVSRILIDGRWIRAKTPDTREIRNPATLELVGVAPECGADDVAAAVESAAHAHPVWWKVPGIEKAVLLHRIAEKVRAKGGELAGLTLPTTEERSSVRCCPSRSPGMPTRRSRWPTIRGSA